MKLDTSMILLNQSYPTKDAAIQAAGQLLVDAGCVEAAYVEAMIERDNLVSTYMGNFVAIPHGTDEAKKFVKKTGISVIQIPEGVDFDTTGTEEKLAMVVFGIAGIGDEHLDLLSKIAIFCSDVENVVRLANADSKEAIAAMLEEVEA